MGSFSNSPVLPEGSVQTVELSGSSTVSLSGSGMECVDNTTTSTLTAGSTYTGTWVDTVEYNVIIIGIIADQDSAVDGLVVEWAHEDGGPATQDDVFTISANAGKVFTFSPANRFFRVKFTNGGVDQGVFNLQTVMKKGGFKSSSHRLQDAIVDEDDVELMKAIISGKNPGGNYVNFTSTTAGNFKVSIEEQNGTANMALETTLSGMSASLLSSSAMKFVDEVGAPYGVKHIMNKPRVSSVPYLYDVSEGNIPNHNYINKFGANLAVGATIESIWEEGDRYWWPTGSGTVRIASNSVEDNITGSGAQILQVSGLDSNYESITEEIEMLGDPDTGGDFALSTGSFHRVNRMKVIQAGSSDYNQGNIVCINEGDEYTLATITANHNQTLMALWTVPSGSTFHLVQWDVSEASKNGAEIHLFVRPFGEAWQLKQYMIITGNSVSREFKIPLVFPARSDIEVAAHRIGASDSSVESSFTGWYES